MKPADYLDAARVPHTLQPQRFGLWIIERRPAPPDEVCRAVGYPPIGWPDYTVLRRITPATLHLEKVDAHTIVMEDSAHELRRHMPIWLAARGRVLVTGLGLGCVVRGLLASPLVDLVDVVEIDRHIIRVVGAEFAGDPRVRIHLGDALKFEFPPDASWDCAWHDLWCDGKGLQLMHGKLLHRYAPRCRLQGAWQFPRVIKRAWPALRGRLLGAKRG